MYLLTFRNKKFISFCIFKIILYVQKFTVSNLIYTLSVDMLVNLYLVNYDRNVIVVNDKTIQNNLEGRNFLVRLSCINNTSSSNKF